MPFFLFAEGALWADGMSFLLILQPVGIKPHASQATRDWIMLYGSSLYVFVLVSFPLLKTTHAHRTRTTTKKTAPEASTNDLRPNQTSLRDGLIWEPSALSGEEVDNYLIMTRGLVEQTSHTRDRHEPRWRRPGVSSTGVPLTVDQEAAAAAVAAAGGGTGDIIPLEADEQALFYLYQQKYRLDMTSLRLTSELGMQKGAHCYCYMLPVAPVHILFCHI